MNLFHPIVLRLCRIQASHHQNYSAAYLSSHSSHTTHFDGSDPTHDPTKDTPTLVSNCRNLSELDQVYARIIRTHLLELHPLPFHWNSIIKSYTRLDSPYHALRIYVAMSRAGVSPDNYTIPIVLKAICQVFDIVMGLQLHVTSIKHALENNEYCESGLINLYSKAGELENARKVFEENPERKLGSWNAIIGGLSQGGRAMDAIRMFLEMKGCGFEPDDVTMVSVTSACGSLGDLDLALQLHRCVFHVKPSKRSDVLMMNSLIDMYGKCGRVDLAYGVFSKMVQRNVSSWTSMIVGLTILGHVHDALECFRCMRQAGIIPNYVTFVAVLSACVHGGLVQEGKHYFSMMKNEYNLTPKLQHYGCMVDLLGRAGLLEEAREMVEGMPMKPNNVIWGCLMGACEKHENLIIGEWVAKHLQELEPWSDGVYVVLSNIYASKGMWKGVQMVRNMKKEKSLAKVPGFSLTTKSD